MQEGHLPHNPSVALVWHTRSFEPFQANPGVLMQIGDPTDVEWYCQGRVATREECLEAIDRGASKLMETASQDAEAMGISTEEREAEIQRNIQWVINNLVPR